MAVVISSRLDSNLASVMERDARAAEDAAQKHKLLDDATKSLGKSTIEVETRLKAAAESEKYLAKAAEDASKSIYKLQPALTDVSKAAYQLRTEVDAATKAQQAFSATIETVLSKTKAVPAQFEAAASAIKKYVDQLAKANDAGGGYTGSQMQASLANRGSTSWFGGGKLTGMAGRAGLYGAVAAGAHDLATNPDMFINAYGGDARRPLQDPERYKIYAENAKRAAEPGQYLTGLNRKVYDQIAPQVADPFYQRYLTSTSAGKWIGEKTLGVHRGMDYEHDEEQNPALRAERDYERTRQRANAAQGREQAGALGAVQTSVRDAGVQGEVETKTRREQLIPVEERLNKLRADGERLLSDGKYRDVEKLRHETETAIILGKQAESRQNLFAAEEQDLAFARQIKLEEETRYKSAAQAEADLKATIEQRNQLASKGTLTDRSHAELQERAAANQGKMRESRQQALAVEDQFRAIEAQILATEQARQKTEVDAYQSRMRNLELIKTGKVALQDWQRIQAQIAADAARENEVIQFRRGLQDAELQKGAELNAQFKTRFADAKGAMDAQRQALTDSQRPGLSRETQAKIGAQYSAAAGRVAEVGEQRRGEVVAGEEFVRSQQISFAASGAGTQSATRAIDAYGSKWHELQGELRADLAKTEAFQLEMINKVEAAGFDAQRRQAAEDFKGNAAALARANERINKAQEFAKTENARILEAGKLDDQRHRARMGQIALEQAKILETLEIERKRADAFKQGLGGLFGFRDMFAAGAAGPPRGPAPMAGGGWGGGGFGGGGGGGGNFQPGQQQQGGFQGLGNVNFGGQPWQVGGLGMGTNVAGPFPEAIQFRKPVTERMLPVGWERMSPTSPTMAKAMNGAEVQRPNFDGPNGMVDSRAAKAAKIGAMGYGGGGRGGPLDNIWGGANDVDGGGMGGGATALDRASIDQIAQDRARRQIEHDTEDPFLRDSRGGVRHHPNRRGADGEVVVGGSMRRKILTPEQELRRQRGRARLDAETGNFSPEEIQQGQAGAIGAAVGFRDKGELGLDPRLRAAADARGQPIGDKDAKKGGQNVKDLAGALDVRDRGGAAWGQDVTDQLKQWVDQEKKMTDAYIQMQKDLDTVKAALGGVFALQDQAIQKSTTKAQNAVMAP